MGFEPTSHYLAAGHLFFNKPLRPLQSSLSNVSVSPPCHLQHVLPEFWPLLGYRHTVEAVGIEPTSKDFQSSALAYNMSYPLTTGNYLIIFQHSYEQGNILLKQLPPSKWDANYG